ncbi:hypothetical protein M2149_000820 [Lachnospiraceae bacterium PFB1-21]
MKQPKKFKREHKELLSKQGLEPSEWGLIREYTEDIHIINRKSGEIKAIEKSRNVGRRSGTTVTKQI